MFLQRLASAFQIRGKSEQEKVFANIKDPNTGSK
jgi:hypothetical protein